MKKILNTYKKNISTAIGRYVDLCQRKGENIDKNITQSNNLNTIIDAINKLL